jgi:hypothetical protein
MTKEQLQKLYNLGLITLVTGEDALLDEIKDMDIEEALIRLKNLEIFNHVVNNDVILNLLSNDANTVAEDNDDVTKSATKEDEDDDSPIVDDGE